MKQECDLCSNQYPYMCAECDDTDEVSKPEIEPEVWTFKQPERQYWIGSGDSGIQYECMNLIPHN